MNESRPTAEQVGKLALAVDQASARYQVMREREAQASSECTSARNALNAAQKMFDTAICAVRAHAPHDSDWQRFSLPGKA